MHWGVSVFSLPIGRLMMGEIEIKVRFLLILTRDKILNLGIGEYRPITADIDISDITSSALTDTALHPLFQGGYHLLRGKAQFFQDRKGKSNHNWRSADNSYGIAG